MPPLTRNLSDSRHHAKAGAVTLVLDAYEHLGEARVQIDHDLARLAVALPLASPHFDSTGVVESACYLLLPFIQLVGVLTWVVLVLVLVLVLAVGIGPFALWGPVYRAKCESDASFGAGLLWGLGAWAYSFYTWITTPRSFARVMLGRSGWAKTRRNAEIGTARIVAKESSKPPGASRGNDRPERASSVRHRPAGIW